MSSPLKSLTGGGGDSTSSMLLPLMMMSMMQQPTDTPTPPTMMPKGSPGTYKNPSPSFVGSAGGTPPPQQVGTKTLLGQ